jgi:eukaryotic-like serine/threonine-protein kinase
MNLIRGAKLGPYEVESPLGAGGMGEVYRALDTRLERIVAIKILPPHLASKPDAEERFEREARTISALNDPHICHVSLAARLGRGPLPMEQVLRYGAEIASGLARAHRAGVVHRDLKPGNTMLTKSGAKLMDFGLAKASPGAPSEQTASITPEVFPGAPGGNGTTHAEPLTAAGTVVGTCQYMSPEQVEGKDADARSDIFALGACLYEMACGKRAFNGRTSASTMAAILHKEPEPLSSLQPLTPPAFERAVRALSKDPEQRWQSAGDLSAELKWIAESSSNAQVIAGSPKIRRGNERLIWGAALLILAAILAWFSFGRPVDRSNPYSLDIVPPAGGRVRRLALSVDGQKLAFVMEDSQGIPQLWIRDMNSYEARQVPGAANANFPFWSPDGEWLAYFADRKLHKFGVHGGNSQAITSSQFGLEGTWSEDG